MRSANRRARRFPVKLASSEGGYAVIDSVDLSRRTTVAPFPTAMLSTADKGIWRQTKALLILRNCASTTTLLEPKARKTIAASPVSTASITMSLRGVPGRLAQKKATRLNSPRQLKPQKIMKQGLTRPTTRRFCIAEWRPTARSGRSARADAVSASLTAVVSQLAKFPSPKRQSSSMAALRDLDGDYDNPIELARYRQAKCPRVNTDDGDRIRSEPITDSRFRVAGSLSFSCHFTSYFRVARHDGRAVRSGSCLTRDPIIDIMSSYSKAFPPPADDQPTSPPAGVINVIASSTGGRRAGIGRKGPSVPRRGRRQLGQHRVQLCGHDEGQPGAETCRPCGASDPQGGYPATNQAEQDHRAGRYREPRQRLDD